MVKDNTRSLMTSTGWSREGETWPAMSGVGGVVSGEQAEIGHCFQVGSAGGDG